MFNGGFSVHMARNAHFQPKVIESWKMLLVICFVLNSVAGRQSAPSRNFEMKCSPWQTAANFIPWNLKKKGRKETQKELAAMLCAM